MGLCKGFVVTKVSRKAVIVSKAIIFDYKNFSLFYWMWTNCAVKSHSWEATSYSASAEFCHLLWNRLHKSLTFRPFPIPINPVHNIQLNFYQIYFNVILPYRQIHTTPKFVLPISLSVITVEEFLTCHACRMSYQYHPSGVYFPNVLWIVTMRLIIIQPSACSSHCLPRSKYSS